MRRSKSQRLQAHNLLRAFALVSTVLCGMTASHASDARQRFSTIEGKTIRLHPSEASFEIPKDWGARTQGMELQEVRKSREEWKAEYTRVLNAALPFSECAVQADQWDWKAFTFAGVRVRGYILDQTIKAVDERISTKGFAAAKRLLGPTIGNVSLAEGELERWHRISISYDAWYYDYGGRANIDFYATEKNGMTIVLVFSYVGRNQENGINSDVEKILKSFSW